MDPPSKSAMSNNIFTFATIVANNMSIRHIYKDTLKSSFDLSNHWHSTNIMENLAHLSSIHLSCFCTKKTILFFEVFRNKVIRHIKMAIRHMWRVANGLDNADLSHRFLTGGLWTGSRGPVKITKDKYCTYLHIFYRNSGVHQWKLRTLGVHGICFDF